VATGILNLGISELGDYIMPRLHRYIGSLLLAAAIVVPALVVTETKAQEAVQVRVYDRGHGDYHNWDDREDRAYRRYLGEQHRQYREYNAQNQRTQRNYWNWRHGHPERY
jgi:hypothetical protein